MKNKFDFGALPIDHDIHLSMIHGKGEDYTFTHFNKDSKQLCVEYVKEYITLYDGVADDIELAKEALELLTR